MSIDRQLLQRIIEGALMASAKAMTVAQLGDLFEEEEQPAKEEIQAALEDIQSEYRGKGFELKEVSSGYRFQVVQEVSTWVSRLWEEKPQKYSRALLETLALVAYRQPITRGDIEAIRGVAVSSQIMKTLMEHEWVRVVGHKDVPGRPAMYATTRKFLDYFNLKNLDELPTLAEIRDLDSLNSELEFNDAEQSVKEAEVAAQKDAAVIAHSEQLEVEAEAGERGEEPAAEDQDSPQQDLVSAVAAEVIDEDVDSEGAEEAEKAREALDVSLAEGDQPQTEDQLEPNELV